MNKKDMAFLIDLIFKIKGYAIKEGMDPDLTIKRVGEWMVAITDIATFKGDKNNDN